MAGLLSDILGLIDRAKQSTRANVGLLMDNPQEYGRQINESARDINRQDTLAVQGKNAMLSGMQPSPEQMAAMAAMRQRAENLSMGFVGSLLSKNPNVVFRGTTYGDMISNKPFTHFSKDINVANQYAGYLPEDVLSVANISLRDLPIQEGAAVFPAKLDIKNPASIKDVKKFAPNVTNVQEAFSILQKQGFDGYVDNYQIVPFSKKQIKSAFEK